MEPSQELAWPGALPRGWTSGFHSEKYSPGPSLSLQLHLVFHSRRTEPWQSGRSPAAARQGAEGRGAGLGGERGAPGGRAHGATAALCESRAHLFVPGSSVHGIFQARILEWIVISPPGNLLDSVIKPTLPVSPALQVDSLPIEPSEKPSQYREEVTM